MSKFKLSVALCVLALAGYGLYWQVIDAKGLREKAKLNPDVENPQSDVGNKLVNRERFSQSNTSEMEVFAARARNGDERAACKLAASLSACMSRANIDRSAAFVTNAIAPLGSQVGEAQIDVLASMSEASEKIAATCEQIPHQIMLSAYDYQVIAANGAGAELDRWLLFRPLLDSQNFLNNLDRWKDYRIRSERYVSELIRQRNLEGLPVLLYVYAPDQISNFRPPYHVDDPATFLGLYRLALEHGVKLPPEVDRAAKQLQQNTTLEINRAADVRHRELGANWSGNLPSEDSFSTARFFSMDAGAGSCL